MSKVTLTESQINEIINQQVKIYLAERNPNYGQDDQLLREGIVEDFFDIVDRFELLLAFIGAFVPFGDLADIVVAMKDFYKKDYIGAFLSVMAAIPAVGGAFTAVKIALKSGKIKNVVPALAVVRGSRKAVINGVGKIDGELASLAAKLNRMAPEFESAIKSSAPKGLLNFAIGRLGYDDVADIVKEASRMTGLVRWGYGKFAQIVIPLFEIFTAIIRVGEERGELDIGVSDLYNLINEEIDSFVMQGGMFNVENIYSALGALGAVPTSIDSAADLAFGATETTLTKASGFLDLATKWGYDDPLKLAKDLGLNTRQEVVDYLEDGRKKGGFDKKDIQ